MFIIFFALGLGGGYLIFSNNNDGPNEQAATEETQNTENREQTDEATEEDGGEELSEAAAGEGQILVERGCVSCHSTSALNIEGGATGPDLSQSYLNVEQKHGVPIDEFLKNPTSAVMSSVISSDPLTDEELEAVVEALRIASEK